MTTQTRNDELSDLCLLLRGVYYRDLREKTVPSDLTVKSQRTLSIRGIMRPHILGPH